MAKLLKNESGYSLVEVMASIIILTIAIIPMVAMFDMGLNSATRSSNYDKARSLANKQLEIAKNRPYDSPTVADTRENFPYDLLDAPNTTTYNASGRAEALGQQDEDTEVYGVFRYDVVKEYVGLDLQPTGSNTDSNMVRITVTVRWGGASFNDNQYKVTGVVAR